MTESVTVALIAAGPPTLIATAALIASLRNGNKIQDVHLSLNSRLSELVVAAKAQGRQDERDAHSVTVEGVPKVDAE
jgi:hypothetical protein